uniref:Uncharacterized protein n=1 Tax=Romanomermis culicivorax TaxID=13658 RepID=A0A915IB72_ROMCU
MIKSLACVLTFKNFHLHSSGFISTELKNPADKSIEVSRQDQEQLLVNFAKKRSSANLAVPVRYEPIG